VINARTITSFFLILCFPALAGQTAQYSPARFADTDKPLPTLIKFPGAGKDADIRIRCDTVIADTAALTRIVCYGPDRKKMSYKNAIYDVIKDVEFVPASINGEAKTVVMQFTLHFVRKDGEEDIYLYPNHGHDADKYGNCYSGVQRYAWGQWSSHACRGHHRRYLVGTRATIGADGSYLGHKLTKGKHELGPCEADINEHVVSGSYIPAMKDGVPVEAELVESFLNYLDPDVPYGY
jgi:hypothetical protein